MRAVRMDRLVRVALPARKGVLDASAIEERTEKWALMAAEVTLELREPWASRAVRDVTAPVDKLAREDHPERRA